MVQTSFAMLDTPSGLTLFIDGLRHVVAHDHPNIAAIRTAIREKRYSDILNLADMSQAVKTWLSTDPDFVLAGDCLTFKGKAFSQAVTNKALNMIERGHSPDSLFNFLRKVRNNPSLVAQKELLLFCVANEFMIHEDGDILAYKSVRDDYTDIHSGKYRNAIGDVLEMDRQDVDDDRNNVCSSGFHFAAHEYAVTWHHRDDARLMIMKINPADVVSIPSDYNNQKGRTCRYEVIAEIPHDTSLPKKEVYADSDF